jgi:Trypsin
VVDQAAALTFNIGGGSYAASQWAYHSNWTGDLAAGYDIAIVKLSTAPISVAPALRYTGSDELGRIGTSVGFGKTGTGLTGAITFDGLKRAGENVIDRFYSGGNKRIFLSDFDNPTNSSDSSSGSSTPLNLEYLIAPGDSGGGVFVDFGSGPRLTGVHSFGTARDGLINFDYGDISGHTRVSLFNSWIDSIIAGGSGGSSGGGKGGKGRRFTSNELEFEAVWAIAVPEPNSLGLLLLGACGLVQSLTIRTNRTATAR